MKRHAFAARISGERAIIREVNQIAGLAACPLAGLSKAAVLQWSKSGISQNLSQPTRERVVELLLSISTRLRLGSTASHRGAIVAPPPQEEIIKQEIVRLKTLLATETFRADL